MDLNVGQMTKHKLGLYLLIREVGEALENATDWYEKTKNAITNEIVLPSTHPLEQHYCTSRLSAKIYYLEEQNQKIMEVLRDGSRFRIDIV